MDDKNNLESDNSGGGQEAVEKKASDWRSARELRETFLGSNVEITRELINLRNNLVADIVHYMKWVEPEAASLVDQWLIGQRKPARGRAAIAASPDAVRLLRLPLRADEAPPKPQGWQSAVQLSSNFVGHSLSINLKMAELREALIYDLDAAGIAFPERVIDDFLIGFRKPRCGQQALAASPDAVRILEKFEMLAARSPHRG